jgi:hypothetical protein
MSLAEGVARTIAFKAYASGAITANALATSASDLDGSSGGKYIRRVSSTLNLKKDTYQSNEVRADRQIQDFRHGVKRVDGSISGEISPGTYFDFMEAACRGTKSSALTLDETDLTSVTSNNGASTFIFAGGDPVALGLRTGDIIRFASLAATANNATNFLVTGFSGGSNRTVAVYPAPTTDAVADTAFTLTSNGASGKAVFVPSSSFVSRKFGLETYSSDIDISQLYTECRVGGFNMQLPATGMGTIDVPFMGRDMEVASAGSAPFFVSPAAATTTGCIAAVNGLLRVGGSTVGVVTGMNIQMDLSPSSDAVVGQNFVPEIFLGRSRVSGSLTAFFEDLTLLNYFKNETEVEVLLYLTASSSATADAMTIYMPRVKLGGADVSTDGEAGQAITLPYTALKYSTAETGIEATTIRFTDTAAT